MSESRMYDICILYYVNHISIIYWNVTRGGIGLRRTAVSSGPVRATQQHLLKMFHQHKTKTNWEQIAWNSWVSKKLATYFLHTYCICTYFPLGVGCWAESTWPLHDRHRNPFLCLSTDSRERPSLQWSSESHGPDLCLTILGIEGDLNSELSL